MVLDIKGNKQISIIYFDENNVRKVRTYSSKAKSWVTENFSQYVSTGGANKNCLTSNWKEKNIKVPNNNAFVDFNGDCRADIFIETVDKNGNTWYEFWVRQKATGNSKTTASFCLVQHDMVSEKHHSALFIDLNNNGAMDFLLLNDNLELSVFYNKGGKQSTKGKLCSKYIDSKPMYDPMNSKTTTKYFYIESLKNDSLFQNATNITLFDANKYDQPSMMRYGDLNLDGYMDLLITVKVDNNTYGTSYLFQNTGSGDNAQEQFEVHTGFAHIEQLYGNQTLYAFYFDVGEMQSMSFVQVVKKGNHSEIKTYLNFMNGYNNRQNFYLKAKGYNGNWQKTVNGKKVTYGALYYGITYQAVISDRKGAKKVAYFMQFLETVLTRSGYNALDQTFVYFGLGQTNNYVENLYITMPLDTEYQRFWNQIIPNSELSLYPGDGKGGILAKDWKLQYNYQKLTRQTYLLLFANFTFLVLLLIPIIYLYREERRQDKKQAIQEEDEFLNLLGE